LTIKGPTVYILSPSDNQDYVYLSGENAKYGGEMIQRKNTLERAVNIDGGQIKTFSGGLLE
jgi:hypothetical protein